MSNPTKEDGLLRMSNIAHVTSDGLATAMILLEHIKRGIYTADEAQDYLINNDTTPPESS